MGKLGQRTISGSSSKGGSQALRTVLRMLKKGDNICMTPDGPRGPFQQAAAGIITAAKLSGKPIIPIAFSAKNHKRLSSWDRFMFVLPFTTLYFNVARPVIITKDTDSDAARTMIEQTMNQQVEHADAHIL